MDGLDITQSGLKHGSPRCRNDQITPHTKPWSGATLDFPAMQAGAGALRDGAGGESGGVSMVERDTGEGDCCTGRCITVAGLVRDLKELCGRGNILSIPMPFNDPTVLNEWICAAVVT